MQPALWGICKHGCTYAHRLQSGLNCSQSRVGHSKPYYPQQSTSFRAAANCCPGRCCCPAEDEWPIKSSRYNGSRGPVLITQHQSTEERCAAAAAFAANFGVKMPVLVDPVPDEHTAGTKDPQQRQQQRQQQQQQQPSQQADAATQQQGSGSSCANGSTTAPSAAAAAAAVTTAGCCSSGSCSLKRGRVVGYGNSGPFDAALAPWPLRFYVLDRSGCLRYKADPKDCQYDLFQLWDYLEQQQKQLKLQMQQQ